MGDKSITSKVERLLQALNEIGWNHGMTWTEAADRLDVAAADIDGFEEDGLYRIARRLRATAFVDAARGAQVSR